MKIREKVKMNREGLEEHGPITIVAFGDSVTHGAVGDGEMDYDIKSLLSIFLFAILLAYVPLTAFAEGEPDRFIASENANHWGRSTCGHT